MLVIVMVAGQWEQVPPHVRPLHAQLPTLERLDLDLELAGDVPDPNMADTLSHLTRLTSLTALALQAGPMRGLLRHLPADQRAGEPWQPQNLVRRSPAKSFSDATGPLHRS
jgi:hypothetical protein